MLPRPSATMSFQPGRPRSACTASEPSAQSRRSFPCGESTITSVPSGRNAVHSGSDFTCATTSLSPDMPTASTSPADQSEKYSRFPSQRGDSTRPRPSSSTFISATLHSEDAHLTRLTVAPGFIADARPGTRLRLIVKLWYRSVYDVASLTQDVTVSYPRSVARVDT